MYPFRAAHFINFFRGLMIHFSESIFRRKEMNDKVFAVVMKEEDATPREKTQEELRLEAEAEARAKQLTLDEFKAQIASKRSEPHFNIRQAGEGTNDKDFGKLVPLNKPIVEENSEEEIVVVVCLYDSVAIHFFFLLHLIPKEYSAICISH